MIGMRQRQINTSSLGASIRTARQDTHVVLIIQAEAAQTGSLVDEPWSALTISPEKVCFIIVEAREFDAKDAMTEPDPGSNPP
jgi:hypothetical protein